MAIVGVITARGGSKGLPGKNVKLMHGKPLIAWTIEAALNSTLDEAYVSSDDDAIRVASRIWGAHVLTPRPAHLADDSASIADVLLEHVVKELEMDEDDVICLLQPTSPLRNAQHIDDACALYESFGRAYPVISVTRCIKPLAWIYTIGQHNELGRPFHDVHIQRRQDASDEHVRPNGAIYVASVAQWRAGLWQSHVKGYVMSSRASVDIDTQDDWLTAQAFMAYQGAKEWEG